MKWIEAIIAVLAEAGRSMHYTDIARTIIEKGYRADYGRSPENSVNSILTRNPNLFESLGSGIYKLVETSVTEKIDWDAIDWDAIDILDKPITGEVEGDSTPFRHKYASDFINSSVLSELEMELLELIVNFRLPLEKGKVCFADILDKLDVEIFEEEECRSLSVDATILREKLGELNRQIAKMQSEMQYDHRLLNLYEPLLNPMRSATEKAEQRLQGASDGKVEFEIPRFGKFVPGNKESKPKVVIYLKSIENNLKSYESRGAVMAGVFVHEMFHAWNYFIAGGRRSVLAIDEPMVEFATLYFLKKLEAFTKSQYHSLKDKVLIVRSNRVSRVHNKQQSIGDVPAYGFGYYLFTEFEKGNVDPIKWIETYSQKSASISRNSTVKTVEDALIPVYPFKSEYKVFKWFEKIIFSGRATLATTRKSTAAKVDLSVSLRKLVLACIKTIGRKCFDAQELYAFAPIFEVCVPECQNLENALKQQLDELVKEGHLDALPNDCYSMKLASVEIKPKRLASTPGTTTKSKKAPSIAFAVKFDDKDDEILEKTAVKTYIESLKHIGLRRVQSVGIMKNGYNLVSDVERPPEGRNKWQDYVDSKYIYTYLSNQDKKAYLYQIADKLGINIKISDI